MPRPRVRNQIIIAARSLLDTGGIKAITTKAVAEHAGVTEASVFNNFGDKSGLIQAIVREAMPEQQALTQCIEGDFEEIESWLEEVFSRSIIYFRTILPMTAPFLSSPQKKHDNPQGFYPPRLALFRRFQTLKTEGQTSERFNPKLAAMMLMGAAMHTATTQLTLGSSDFDESVAGSELIHTLGMTLEAEEN
ncbi:TetR/AcrR family transcriptional regulator [Endozoicomonas arenosclerae]|uniref:TetR/AcrR family transcriptional regulator n=1 Tax=Endozoicomonas arenosclerae TaxID=1633495 RepID=UPI0007823B39|nr:TetR/AcrR family transcriptional regulator [Endozoicomonas arenosclerae]